ATATERRNAAVATTVVTGAELTAVPAPALDRALQGRVPGAYIQQNSGAPGGGTQVQIRGSNTVVGSADPLFVVDGVIVSDASLSTGLFSVTASGNPQSTRNDGEKQDDPVNRLTDLNPNDVESIEILRGAAASSIYGSKGVNGVVIIRTKRGRAGTPRANLDQSFSDRLSVSLSSAFNRTTTQRGFTNNDNAGASVTYALAYIPGFVPLKPANGAFPDPGGLSYFGANPLQTTALGTNDEAAVRFTGGLTARFQAVQTARHNLRFVGAGGIDFFNQKDEVFAPRELFFEARQTNPGASTLSNADSRLANWNANAIHSFTPAGGAWKATTALGVQWEDRALGRSRVIARGLLPGQKNINQGSVINVFEENTHERTIALYGHEDWLGAGERLSLSASVRAERSSANGDVKKFYLFTSV